MKGFGLLCWMVWLLGVVPLRGHQVDTVEFEFLREDGRWVWSGEMDIAYMLPETRGVPGGPPLSRKAVMAAPREELERIRHETRMTLGRILAITFAGEPVEWQIRFPDFEKDPFELPKEDMDWALLTVRLEVAVRAGPGALRMHWSGEEESELIVLIADGGDGRIVSVPPGGDLVLLEVEADGAVRAADERPLAGGWLWSGYRHVLPLGLDHMLFIVGLFLLAPRWRPLMWQSFLFTLAHSLTLALAVLGLLEVNGRLVEVFIAFSIAFIGVENLMAKKVGKLRYGLVFGFGLVHGLGFASVLGAKLEQVPEGRLAWPLIGFNAGVELAQITLLATVFLVLWPLREWDGRVRTAGSALVALAGIGLMLERLFGG